jgi:hypothetical protein
MSGFPIYVLLDTPCDLWKEFSCTASFILTVISHIAFKSAEYPKGNKVEQTQDDGNLEAIEGHGDSDGTGIPDTGG